MKMPITTKSLNTRNGDKSRYSPQNRSLAAVVALTLLTALLGMTAYEYLKQILIPNIAIWESHTIAEVKRENAILHARLNAGGMTAWPAPTCDRRGPFCHTAEAIK